jgi:hypothetical protein
MKYQDVSGGNLAREASEDGVRISVEGIEPAPSPGNVPDSEAREHRIEKRIAQPHRRAEKSGRASANRAQCFLRRLGFAAQPTDLAGSKRRGRRMTAASAEDRARVSGYAGTSRQAPTRDDCRQTPPRRTARAADRTRRPPDRPNAKRPICGLPARAAIGDQLRSFSLC